LGKKNAKIKKKVPPPFGVGGGGRGIEMYILGNIAAETKVFQIGIRDIRQQSGASARVAKPRNFNVTQDRIVRRARDILCKEREYRRNHLQVHFLTLWT